MCGRIVRGGSLFCLAILQTLCAIPALLVFFHTTGLAFFIVAFVLCIVSMLLTHIQAQMLSWTTRLGVNLFIAFPFILLELALTGWSLYVVYLFIIPFAAGGWETNCPKNLGYSGLWDSPGCDSLKVWYGFGIGLTLFLAMGTFCLILSAAFYDELEQRSRLAEAEPLVPRSESQDQTAYNTNASKYV